MIFNTNSELYYNKMNLRKASLGATKYLDSIDKTILSSVSFRPSNYLDIGCGDGIRAQRFVRHLEPHSSTFIDSSPEMVKRASQLGIATCLCKPIKDITAVNQYDLITCLWNVFGHLKNREAREEGLTKIHDALSPRGLFFIDFNNRYNFSHYGLKGVLGNLLKDLLNIPSAGWFPLNSESSVYIHHFIEAKKLLKSCGFRINKTYSVNYRTGRLHSLPYFGQTLFVLSKK
jgi:2-polyprenyl-3-methyl-5-hydroxy-6-metoxy-1,4-benzoquinol methylase